MQNMINKLVFVPLLAFLSLGAWAQQSGAEMKQLPLDDMSAFKPQAGNWFVVGDVLIDPTVDVHHKPEAKKEETSGKKKKKKKKKKGHDEVPPEAAPQAVTYEAGKGILLNLNSEGKRSNLVTTLTHGDIELELDVMLPKGSNSGLYLQGRYEVQLYDSWGVIHPAMSDIGGIYRNWESDPAKSYMGKAPDANAAKAPGLWQHLKIMFLAPRFNAQGEKIQNAKLISVELNGVKIHDHVEIPKPTGGPVENNEVPMGPIMIQGDHGAVAIRNIRYRLLHDAQVSVSDLSYDLYKGTYESVEAFNKAKPVSSGKADKITWEVSSQEDGFGIVYKGTLHIDEDDQYTFAVRQSGVASLIVDGKEVIAPKWGGNKGTLSLKKGTYPFKLAYYKNVGWQDPRLGFFVQGANTHEEALHAFNSFPPGGNSVAPIYVHVGNEPRHLRAFLDFKGDRNRRLSHTIGVGTLQGIHYIYDLKAGDISCVWRGDFIDATPMWHSRGDGSFRPLGMTQYLFTDPSLAALPDGNADFPAVSDEKVFRGKGYSLDRDTKLPVFQYTYKDVEVTDKITPDATGKLFIREVTFKNAEDKSLSFKIAEGSDIIKMPDGSFAVDGKQYYVHVLSAHNPTIRTRSGKQELVLTVDGTPIKYSIIW